MSNFNFSPALTGFKFYRCGRGFTEDEAIDSISLEDYDESKGIDTFELGIELKLSGMKNLIHPYMTEEFNNEYVDNDEYQPFFLNIITLTVRGGLDTIIHSINSTYIGIEYLKEDNLTIRGTIMKFNNHSRKDNGLIIHGAEKNYLFDYNFVDQYFSVLIFTSENRIDIEDYEKGIYNQNYNILLNTKLPIDLPNKWGDQYDR